MRHGHLEPALEPLESSVRQEIWCQVHEQVPNFRYRRRTAPTTRSQAIGCWHGSASACCGPGGVELTRTLLSHAKLNGADVVEPAPGLGRTAAEIVAQGPAAFDTA